MMAVSTFRVQGSRVFSDGQC